MSEIKITIENCNNISKGVISLEEEKLNIRYGMNGTGKSTLSTAISLFSQGKPMDDLKPFGSDDEVIPTISIDGDIQGVRVFNEDFVNNMVFKESTVIDNAFDVFIRTSDYEQKRQNLDNRLLRLKVEIDEKPPIIQLKNDIAAFAGKLELNAAGKNLKNNTNYKAIVKKNNVYNIPDGLKKYSPIISDDQICINWIDWKSRGEAFDTILPRSFYKKTVLMLTHDFEPIIDFGVVGKLPEDALNSKFIKNNQGILTEKAIDYKQDIKPVVQALAAYIKDDTLGIVHRIAFLRKYYEHNGIENYKEAYDVLSSLIHGRDKCKYVNNSEMPQAEIQKGCTEIKKWIQNFDYDELYRDVYNEEKLAELYFAETNDYLKIQLFRALFEVNPSREIKEEDVLVKFINESYHIENDYAYYLDMVKFETVPEYIVKAIDDYMERTYSKA